MENEEEAKSVVEGIGTPPTHELIRCPRCGAQQFFGRRKITALGWTLLGVALLIILVSVPLMFVWVGFCTIFLAIPLPLIAVFGCRKHVNTCANCRKDF